MNRISLAEVIASARGYCIVVDTAIKRWCRLSWRTQLLLDREFYASCLRLNVHGWVAADPWHGNVQPSLNLISLYFFEFAWTRVTEMSRIDRLMTYCKIEFDLLELGLRWLNQYRKFTCDKYMLHSTAVENATRCGESDWLDGFQTKIRWQRALHFQSSVRKAFPQRVWVGSQWHNDRGRGNMELPGQKGVWKAARKPWCEMLEERRKKL